MLSYSSTRFSWACKKRIVLCHNCHTLSPSTNGNPLSFHTRNKRGGLLHRPAKPESFIERRSSVVFHSFHILYLVDDFLILALGLEVHGEADDGTNGTADDGADDQ